MSAWLRTRSLGKPALRDQRGANGELFCDAGDAVEGAAAVHLLVEHHPLYRQACSQREELNKISRAVVLSGCLTQRTTSAN